MQNSNQYKKNFLKSVVLRVDFEKIPNFDDKKFDSLLSDYSMKKVESKMEFLTTLSKDRQTIDSKTFNIYRYSNNSATNCFCISETFCYFELKDYVGFNDLKNKFAKVLETLKSDLSSDIIERVGLRYTNDVNVGNDLEKCIPAELLSNDAFYNTIKTLSKDRLPTPEKSLCLGRISFKDDDNVITNFVFGNANENYPAIITNESFLLDYDSFSNNIDKDKILDTLEKLHDRIKFLFESSITEHLRNKIK